MSAQRLPVMQQMQMMGRFSDVSVNCFFRFFSVGQARLTKACQMFSHMRCVQLGAGSRDVVDASCESRPVVKTIQRNVYFNLFQADRIMLQEYEGCQ
jgi:hypothetical protein